MSALNPEWFWCSLCKTRHYYIIGEHGITWPQAKPVLLEKGTTLSITFTWNSDTGLVIPHQAYLLREIEK